MTTPNHDNPDLDEDDRIKITGEVFTPPKLSTLD